MYPILQIDLFCDNLVSGVVPKPHGTHVDLYLISMVSQTLFSGYVWHAVSIFFSLPSCDDFLFVFINESEPERLTLPLKHFEDSQFKKSKSFQGIPRSRLLAKSPLNLFHHVPNLKQAVKNMKAR